jgi:anti-sigma regulatory factor (Ser/Thr protein kinase)
MTPAPGVRRFGRDIQGEESYAEQVAGTSGWTAMETLALPVDPTSVARARAFVRAAATGHLDDPFAAELLTSELVGNVVSHAPRDLTVAVDAGPPFRVEVHDGAVATSAFRRLVAQGPPPAPAFATSGRGLVLVHELAARVGMVEEPGQGKVVWFEL